MVELLVDSEMVERSVYRFRMVPRVGDQIIVRPGSGAPRRGAVRSVVHAPARRSAEGEVVLRVAMC
ncbi:hypothetical protein [Aureimonas sp. AU22]|uniref:hypothetical protein n=1 Tax=Aureimonas sp. AU22 TaxID=1638162 RepID=UPI000B207843|nr:hypothetical protein [Aureimonas sp. AU22]